MPSKASLRRLRWREFLENLNWDDEEHEDASAPDREETICRERENTPDEIKWAERIAERLAEHGVRNAKGRVDCALRAVRRGLVSRDSADGIYLVEDTDYWGRRRKYRVNLEERTCECQLLSYDDFPHCWHYAAAGIVYFAGTEGQADESVF